MLKITFKLDLKTVSPNIRLKVRFEDCVSYHSVKIYPYHMLELAMGYVIQAINPTTAVPVSQDLVLDAFETKIHPSLAGEE